MLGATNRRIIAIGASTGGVDALERVFARLPVTILPTVVVIHMQERFTRLFADRINDKYPVNVKEAVNGDLLKGGQVLIAPGGKHTEIINRGKGPEIRCFAGPRVHHVIPAADILFDSVANIFGRQAIGVILTGMGADGAAGLLNMRNKGAVTIGQNKETCAVYGMPKVAFEMGAVEHVLPLDKIGDKIVSLAR